MLETRRAQRSSAHGRALAHRHAFSVASSQFWPSNPVLPRIDLVKIRPSRQRTLTSILSGSKRGT